MYRSMMQVFVKESDKALEFYQKAFDAKVLCCYPDSDGLIMHAELDIYGQVMAVSESSEENVTAGNTMMFCLEFGEGKEAVVRKIYEVLKDGAVNASPPNPCEYSSLQFVAVDKFGVWWCIYV